MDSQVCSAHNQCTLADPVMPDSTRNAFAGDGDGHHCQPKARELRSSVRAVASGTFDSCHGISTTCKGFAIQLHTRECDWGTEYREIQLHRRRSVEPELPVIDFWLRAHEIDPFKVIRTGPGQEIEGDPMTALQKELAVYKYVKIPEIPTFTGYVATAH